MCGKSEASASERLAVAINANFGPLQETERNELKHEMAVDKSKSQTGERVLVTFSLSVWSVVAYSHLSII